MLGENLLPEMGGDFCLVFFGSFGLFGFLFGFLVVLFFIFGCLFFWCFGKAYVIIEGIWIRHTIILVEIIRVART